MPSYVRDASYGPRRIKTVTKEFERTLRGVLERLNAVIREAIVERDILGIRPEALARDDVDEPDSYAFESRRQTVNSFTDWLSTQLEEAYLTVVGRDENQYVRRAYVEGARRATKDVREQGVDIDPFDSGLLDTYTDRRALQELYERTFGDLRSVSEDMAQAVREELSTALLEGESPKAAAKRITDRVNKIGKYRSTLIAQTELMESHSTAEVNRLRDLERNEDVTLSVSHGSWETARDDNVCSVCQSLQGITFTLDEFENGSFRVDGYDFQLKPPAHPGGRCHIGKRIGFDPADLAPISERMSEFEAYSI